MSTNEIRVSYMGKPMAQQADQCSHCDQNPLYNQHLQAIQCNQCGVLVHKACYEAAHNEEAHGEWKCGACQINAPGINAICQYCPVKEGALIICDRNNGNIEQLHHRNIQKNIGDSKFGPQLKHIQCTYRISENKLPQNQIYNQPPMNIDQQNHSNLSIKMYTKCIKCQNVCEENQACTYCKEEQEKQVFAGPESNQQDMFSGDISNHQYYNQQLPALVSNENFETRTNIINHEYESQDISQRQILGNQIPQNNHYYRSNISGKSLDQTCLDQWGFAKEPQANHSTADWNNEEQKTMKEGPTNSLLGKRSRIEAQLDNIRTNSPTEQIILNNFEKPESENSNETFQDKSESIQKQKRKEDSKQNDEQTRSSRLTKAQDVSTSQMIQDVELQSDPCTYIVKDIIIPIMFQIDKLQILKRDKQMFEVKLESKDLKQFSKEKRYELMSKKVYYDYCPKENAFEIIVRYDHPEEEGQIENDSLEDKSSANKNNEFIDPNQFNNMCESSSPYSKSPGSKDDANDLGIGEEMSDPLMNAENQNFVNESEDNQFLQPKKKKRRRTGLTMSKQKTNVSKSLMNLPSSMSDFSWIENTEKNKIIIQQEREKQNEVRRQKELLKSNQLQLELKPTFNEEQMIYQDETVTIVEVDNGLNVISNKEKPEQIDTILTAANVEMNVQDNYNQQIDKNNEERKEQNIELQLNQNNDPNFFANQINSEENQSVQQQPAWSYKNRSDSQTLDDIKDRVDDGYYHSLEALCLDIEGMIKLVIKDRCRNDIAKTYLTNVMQKATYLINSKQDDYKQRWRNYYESRFNQNELHYPKVKQWWKAPGAKREYNTLEDYKIVTTLDQNQKQALDQNCLDTKESISKKMKTTKTAQCQGDCCNKIEDLGPFKLNNDIWETKCACRLKKVECSNHCGCDPQVCKNRQMSLKQSLKLGVDVIERTSWGIDMCTAVNLMGLLPRDIPPKLQSEFVERKLVYAIQQQADLGYDVRRALRFIINSQDNDRYEIMDKELASVVLDGILNCKRKNQDHFRVHSKGIGIFCQIKEGIKANNIIIEYFGEIYQPWSWYEKQDVLKQGQNKSQLSKELPDFYNITYERHQDDPQGYDILMVDPILYGNYSSRLSHSCNPNCSTIIHVRNGEYSIGMYAIKNVNFGDELCFNYCSLTESEKEYETAVCLCGTEICQGKFLQLASDKKHLTILKQYHTFVDRNYLIWKACKYPNLNQEEWMRLEEFGLKSSVMNGVPNWLAKWASLLCEYIHFEEQQYPKTFQKDFPTFTEEDLKIDAKNLRDGKLWNVAITIDKVMRVLKQMNMLEPPIKDLSFRERYFKLWDDENSLKSSLIEVIHKIEDCEQKVICYNLIMQNYKIIDLKQVDSFETEKQYEEHYNNIRAVLAQISDILRPIQSQTVTIAAFCDILWLYANIETYFTPNKNYKKCKGEEICIRKCDVRCESGGNQQGSLNPVDQEKTVYKGCKEYDPGYIWGQLVGWFKQTVDKPNASLSADRRGTLSMPDLESFLVSQKNQNTQKVQKSRRKNKNNEDDIDGDDLLNKQSGTRSRPNKSTKSAPLNIDLKSVQSENNNSMAGGAKQDTKFKEPLTRYPHKKHQTRQAFLDNWSDNFSKQWDVCCNWSFKNKQRMYGSIQFESILKADNDRQRRLDSFNTVVGYLQRHK